MIYCLQPKDTHDSFIEEQRNQKTLIFKKVESEFCPLV